MVSLKTPIVLVGIAIAIIVLILSFRKFALPALGDIGGSLSETFGGFGSGITDFFESFETDSSEKQKEKEQQSIFDEQVKQKEQDALDAGFSNVADFERETDPNRDITKFNPDGIIGFGFDSVNEGKGLPDTQENRNILDDLFDGLSSVFSTPQAFAEESIQIIPTEQKKPRENNIVQSGLDTGQQFKGGGSSFIGGEIRKTPITKNSTLGFIIDELGVSASEAASIRADLRGDLDNFDLGTNTGSGQKGSSPKAKQDSLDERLRKAAEDAKKIFDSGGISNF